MPTPKSAYKLSLLPPASAASWALMALSSDVVLEVCMELKRPAGVRLMLELPEPEELDALDEVPLEPLEPLEPLALPVLPVVPEDDPVLVARGIPTPPCMDEAKFCALAKSPFCKAVPS